MTDERIPEDLDFALHQGCNSHAVAQYRLLHEEKARREVLDRLQVLADNYQGKLAILLEDFIESYDTVGGSKP